MFVSTLIRQERRRQGYKSANDLAKELGISSSTIYCLEQGRHKTIGGHAEKVCRKLGINLHNMIDKHQSNIDEAMRLIQEVLELDESNSDLVLSLIRAAHKSMTAK